MAIPTTQSAARFATANGQRSAIYALVVLGIINLFQMMDRVIFAVLVVPIRAELHLSDTQIGLIAGFAFALFYAVLGLPLGRLADTRSRIPLLATCMIVWSAMTAACGAATNALQMVLSRIGVGVGEAGCVPAAQSLIGDIFPAERRALAVSLFQAAGILGSMGGMMLAGVAADRFGWRSAFYLLGAPGILVALVAWGTLREPERRIAPVAAPLVSGLAAAMGTLLRKRAFVHVLIALSIGAFAGHGMGIWIPAFLSRTHGLSLTQIGLWSGAASGGGGAIGAVVGGFGANALIRRDRRWEVWFPACTYLLAIPAFLTLFLSPNAQVAIAGQFVAMLIIGSGSGPALSAIQATATYAHRATAIALVLLSSSILGLGVAPLVVGLASDALFSTLGATSLRWALVGATSIFVLPVAHFLLAGRTLRAEASGDEPASR